MISSAMDLTWKGCFRDMERVLQRYGKGASEMVYGENCIGDPESTVQR